MRQEEINKGNKIIAEFMGAKMIVTDYYGINIIKFPDESTKDLFGLKYHSSWDWLMPVVNKCLDVLEQVDGNSSDEQRMHIGEALQEAKIEDLYASVIRCIKWYNNQIK